MAEDTILDAEMDEEHGESEGQGQESEISEAQKKWMEALDIDDPAIYDRLSDEEKEQWLKDEMRRAGNEAADDGGGTADEESDPVAAQAGDLDLSRIVSERFDPEQAQQTVTAFAESAGMEGDAAEGLGKLVASIVKAGNETRDLVIEAYNDLRQSAVEPQKWASALSSVEGASDSDVAAAKKIMQAEGIQSHKAALELAVYRAGRTNKKKPLPASQRQRARVAYTAFLNSISGPKGGRTATNWKPGTVEGIQSYFEDIERRKKQGR